MAVDRMMKNFFHYPVKNVETGGRKLYKIGLVSAEVEASAGFGFGGV